MKTLVIRTLVILATIFGMVFICTNTNLSPLASIWTMFGILVIFAGVIYFSLHNLSKNEINKILGIDWLTQKTGLNFSEE